MAKRIKVKGKNPPRGLSKVERRAYAHAARTGDHDLKISVDMNRDRNISRTPSSTRKKLVKEGNPKFIGPRTFKSELTEDLQTRMRGVGPDVLIKDSNRGQRKIRGVDDYDQMPLYGRGSIGSKKLKRLLDRLLDRLRGGGQEFDDMD